MSQLASSMSRPKSQGKLPVQTEHDPKHTVSTISWRSGQFYEGPSNPATKNEENEEVMEEKKMKRFNKKKLQAK